MSHSSPHRTNTPPSVSLDSEVILRYSAIPEVVRIHAYRAAYHIITSPRQYSEALMDKLLDIEWELLQTNPDTEIDIDYMPEWGQERSTMQPIYSRK